MRLLIVLFLTCSAGLSFWGNGWAQGITGRETMIHKNVKLAEMAAGADIPSSIADQYRKVLPVFRKVLEQNTKDQPDAKRMLIRVEAGVREIGSAKTSRPLAQVTASCRNSTREYVGSMILHSYLTNGPVNEAEIEEFLRIQILDPMDCYVPTARVFGSPKVEEEIVTTVVEATPVAAETPVPVSAPVSAPVPAPVAAKASSVRLKEAGSESEIHRNVYLLDRDAAPDMPAELAGMYRRFLPVFKEVLKECTQDHSDENRLTMMVAPGMREVGALKAKRAQVRITSVIGNSNKEYITDFSLYSYASNNFVNRDEIAQFLRRQILEPLECYVPAGRAFGAATADSKPESTSSAAELPRAKTSTIPAAGTDRRVDIHQNVRLVELTAPDDIPADILDNYREFLPIFNEVLQKNTQDQPEEKRITIRVQAGAKEVGSARTKRALANVTASCRNSTRRYLGNLILYSYATSGPVNEEETEQFLRKQILEPSECYVPTERVYSSK